MRVFGPDSKEVTGDCRNMHTGTLHDLYLASNTIGVIRTRIRDGRVMC